MKKIDDIINYIKDKSAVNAYNELVDVMGFNEDEASNILGVKTFKDLEFEPHCVVPKGVAAVMYFPLIDEGDGGWFSVIGGGKGFYGDGKTSFEVFSENMSDPLAYLGKDNVTEEMLKIQKTKYEL